MIAFIVAGLLIAGFLLVIDWCERSVRGEYPDEDEARIDEFFDEL